MWKVSSGFKNGKSGTFQDGCPADIHGSFAGYPSPKTSVRAINVLEKQAFWRRHPSHEGADVHNPKRLRNIRSEKLWAEVSFPKKLKGKNTNRQNLLVTFSHIFGTFPPTFALFSEFLQNISPGLILKLMG